MKINKQKQSLIVVAMVCVALIMGVYGGDFLGGPFTGWFGPPGGDTSVSPSPTATPTYTPGDDDGETSTPTPTVTSSPTPEQQNYLWLNMNPNPATQRDTVLGEVWSNFNSVQVTVHYIDGHEHFILVTLDSDGYGSFEINFKTGTYDFWATYSTLESNHVVLVVTS